MRLWEFVHETNWEDLAESTRSQARRCLLDTLGAGFGGRQTELSQIIHDFAASVYGGGGAHLWLDGRQVSPPGAALANGMTIDSLDVHDGYALSKGHAGAAIVPAVLATISPRRAANVSGQELLVTLVIGYEVALRAAVALHATVPDYHTSGAWNALGCAAVTSRRLGLDDQQTRHALGIAEYHGPRSQMMRCIDHPTMVKDGSGWGAMAGVSAALLAGDGFTGAPAVTVEAAEVAEYWDDVGARWLTNEQYFKPYAVCRWAQPPIAAVLSLRRTHNFQLEAITAIRVTTFHEAIRLACRHPKTTEEAQYSLPYPLAAALVHKKLGPEELSGEALRDPLVLKLSDSVELVEDPALSARFPARRIARVEIETADGAIFDSGEVEAAWGAAEPPTDSELLEKFRWLASTGLPASRAAELETMIWECASLPNVAELLELLALPQVAS